MTSPDPVFLILSFEHPANAVDSVAEAMANGLRCHGVDAAVCTLPRDLAKLSQLPADRVCGMISMGSLPLSARIGGRPLWEHFPVPVSVYLLDALIYDLSRVPAMGDFLVAALQNPRLSLISPEDGYRRWLGQALPVRWSHLPFAAFPQITPHEPAPDRQARLCVVGTVGSELGGSPATETLEPLLQRLLGQRVDASLRAALVDALLAEDAEPMPAMTVCRVLNWELRDALTSGCLPVLTAVDSWAKRHRRIQAVRSLAGLPCDFFGHGWAELLGEVPGFRYVGQIRHTDIAKLSVNYLGLVNFDPNWRHGVHDRVFTVTAMGVRVLTNDNAALDSLQLPPSLVTRYDANRPALAERVADSGWLDCMPAPAQPSAEVMAQHNWGTRMGQWLAGPAAGVEIAAPSSTQPAATRPVTARAQAAIAA
jgi:hypothetical protein